MADLKKKLGKFAAAFGGKHLPSDGKKSILGKRTGKSSPAGYGLTINIM